MIGDYCFIAHMTLIAIGTMLVNPPILLLACASRNAWTLPV